MQKPLLSICIPTYNRIEFLEQTLNALISQITDKLMPMIEVVISDNSSSDGTDILIQNFQTLYPNSMLRYFRQPVNIGAIRNIDFIVRTATGAFVYLLADDDILLPGALSRITSVIRSQPNLDAICPNTTMLSMVSHMIKMDEAFQNDDLLLDKNEAIIRIGTMLTFLSKVIFPRDIITNKIVFDTENHFPHSFFFLQAIARERGCLFLSQQCMAIRENLAVNYDLIQVFVHEFASLLEYALRTGYSVKAIHAVLSEHSRWMSAAIYHFSKTSYRPILPIRVIDMLKVLKVWWRDPVALLRVEASILLTWEPLKQLRAILQSGRRIVVQ